ncbi:hypothetical protein Clacol_002745 [Clathrus columnatus]|uniref:Carnosine N-methyltransferase n=1 Tax=Clathrus columnatus TaxID=1419009 RepID=A0AAV5A4I4_9AGAM|nr:hypothetical protein Clacol_002745 [Clathrus columnatus]
MVVLEDITYDALIYTLLALILMVCLSKRETLINMFWNMIQPPQSLDEYQRYERELRSAAAGYAQYSMLANYDLYRMRYKYGTMSRFHKNIGGALGYPKKLDTLAETIEANALITTQISAMFGKLSDKFSPTSKPSPQALERIRDVLKQFVREWSSEGASERQQTFPYIFAILEKIPIEARITTTVVVPGSGLGRLAWEIAQMGFPTLSNENSSYMNLAFRFLTSRTQTLQTNQHVIHPFSYWFSHQRSNSSLFREVRFPDVLPTLSPSSFLQHAETDFLNLEGEYDYVITHFFIDTSNNIISTIQKIHSLLKPGGTWINVGPLLWMTGAQSTMEMSLDEILQLSEMMGFTVHESSRQTIDSEYTRNELAMIRWIYEAEFWVATKGQD